MHYPQSQRLKITQNIAFEFFNFGIFEQSLIYFKSYLSGNTVWLEALGFQKITKLAIFGILMNFCLLFARNIECDSFCNFQSL